MAQELPNIQQSQPGFSLNPYYEKLLELRLRDPRAFASISPASKLALFEYEKQRREHERLTSLGGEKQAPPVLLNAGARVSITHEK